MQNELRERLAEYAHEAWSGWMKYMLDTLRGYPDKYGGWTITPQLYQRWNRQMHTAYAALPESEKASDRDEADKILAIYFNDMNKPDPIADEIGAMTPEQIDEELRKGGYDPKRVAEQGRVIAEVVLEGVLLRKELATARQRIVTLEDKILDIIAEFGDDPVQCLQILAENIQLRQHYRAYPNAPRVEEPI